MPEQLRRFAPMLALAAMTIALFAPLLAGRGLSGAGALAACCEPWAPTPDPAPPGINTRLSDQYLFFEPNEEFISRWVRRGVWPLWNPGLAHGLPTVAGIQSAEYYPTNLLLWPLPPFWTRGPRAIARIATAFAGMYGLCRTLGIATGGATLAALMFAFSGSTIVMLGYPVSNVSVLLPGILWTLERTLQVGTFGWGAGLALLAGAALLGGHTPTVLHATTVVVIWLAYRLVVPEHPRPRLPVAAAGWRLALCAVAAALIGSAALLPWVGYVTQNVGAASTWRVTRILSWKALVTWVVPKFYGDPINGLPGWDARFYGMAGWENYIERTGFVGVAGLLLAAYALVAYRPWHALVPGLTVLIMSVIFIYDPPLVGSFARAVPPFSIVNNSRMIGIAAFALAILGGFGCDALLNGTRRLVPALAAWAVATAALAGLVVALWPHPEQRAWLTQVGALHGLVADTTWAIVPAIGVLAAILLARSHRGAALTVLFAVTMIDLWRCGVGFNPTIRPADVVTPPPGIEYLRQHPGGRVLPLGVRMMPGNTLLHYELADVRGGDWINVKQYEYLVSGRTGHYDFGRYLSSVPSTVDALNVSYAVVPPGTALPAGVQPVYDGELRIFAVAGLPRALLVHDARVVADDAEARTLIVNHGVDLEKTALLASAPAATTIALPGGAPRPGEGVTVTRETPNELALSVDARDPGYLVVNDTFAPGWRCSVDGVPAEIVRANVAFRAVALPVGNHEVIFRYRPRSALLGIALAASTVLGIATIGVARTVRRRSERPSR